MPLLAAMFVAEPRCWAVGLAIMTVGEGIRLAAVGHIGLASRTRGDGVGPLVESGPYARMRNPLYAGNVLLFAGLGIVLWPTALFAVPLIALHYSWIVRWEKRNLAERLGRPYRDYVARVPRWWPTGAPHPGRWDVRRALRSERSTLFALAAVGAALGARSMLF